MNGKNKRSSSVGSAPVGKNKQGRRPAKPSAKQNATARPAPTGTASPSGKRTVPLRRPGQPKTAPTPNTVNTAPRQQAPFRPRQTQGTAPNTPRPAKRPATKGKAKPSARRTIAQEPPKKSSIRMQSPAQRKAVRNEKHISGSLKNMEVNRRTHREKQTYRIKRKVNPFRMLARKAASVAIAFAIVFAVYAGYFTLRLHAGSNEYGKATAVSVGNKNDERHYMYSAKNMQTSRGYYICADDLPELYDIAVTGDSSELRYVLYDNNEYVSFFVGSRIATVNGTTVVTELPSQLRGGRLYIPADFVTAYMKDAFVSFEDDVISLERVEAAPSPDGTKNYLPIELRLSPNSTITALNEDDFSGNN